MLSRRIILPMMIVAGFMVSSGTMTVSVTAMLIDGKCSNCMNLGLKSTVECLRTPVCTVMFCGYGLYDEDGEYHLPKKCNSCTQNCKCSNGHQVAIIYATR